MQPYPGAPAAPFRRGIARLTGAILLVGLGSAAVIFLLAAPASTNPLGYEPLQSKRYVHDLEVYGGTCNVLAEEFRGWFMGLWQGRRLALTVAVITVATVLLIRFVAAPRPPAMPHRSDRGERPKTEA